jgi:exodeoxyribonuclease V alpha subunit
LLGLREGDELKLSGHWIQHPRFGPQFEVESYVQVMPNTRDGLQRFLGSGKIRGLGPRRAQQVVERFGLDSLTVIEEQPERLQEISGIGPATVEKVRQSWQEHRGIQHIIIFLSSHGVSPTLAVKAFRRYGAAAVDVVRDNPYRLADDVFGVGFVTADRIAQQLGIPPDALERRAAGILHTLREAATQGHVFLPQGQLLDSAAELLGACDSETLTGALNMLLERKQVRRVTVSDHPPAVYLTRLETAEATTAAGMRSILEASAAGEPIVPERAVTWFEAQSGVRLAATQRRALAAALTDKAVIITGGPGTGKTTLVRGLVETLEAKGRTIVLAAPTGRAAKRLAETTGSPARTIHRLLEFNPISRSFNRNRAHPLEADCLVVDELSMLDIELASSLLDAVPAACRVVFVGDTDQLPSVGPGNVLADLIESRQIPVHRLQDVFRQAEQSLIVVNAHRVNTGRLPKSAPDPEQGDFFFIARDDPGDAAELIVDLATTRIPQRYGFDPFNDIQVLSPMHRGELGVMRLNERLQARLTPSGRELAVGWRRFRFGDKVMQVRNNYELDVYNGDLGRIAHIDHQDRELTVRFDERLVQVPSEDLDDVMPAYAFTIHKAQGSEYPAVVIALHHQHHIMLQRNLLYTAITRGQRLVVLVGSKRALARAVQNDTVRARYSLLASRLDPESAALIR